MKVTIGIALLVGLTGCMESEPAERLPARQVFDGELRPAALTQTASPVSRPQQEPAQKAQPHSPKVNVDAAVLADFKQRVNAYVAIHNEAKKSAPRAKETTDPAKIQGAEEGLAASIRALRADAKPGDIFTREIRAKFRRLLYPETIKGDDDSGDAKEILKEDAPQPGTIPFKVNAKYPEGAPLPTVPVNMLMQLPTLPEELEYRILGKHLILRDTTANIIVDYMLNVIR